MWAGAEPRLELFGELVVPEPAASPQPFGTGRGELGRALHLVRQGGHLAIPDQLQRPVVEQAIRLEERDELRAVAAVHGGS
ncbi:hypothetical protein H7X46_20495 [Pseudonocardia sp. C8]|uniref:hypothetical protein n=1 Tax=Pseudonocardia sp. C8 TaxID=2762759 RepID=UPI001642CB76|nr:hypothetical protein [Pseudonocardia sp. C8]MBC3193444.1 hypothetical protein [Pseudonocardia sp. C8]